MLLRSKIQPAISVSLALTFFALNLQCPAYAETDDKRRQKLVFQFLSSSVKDSSTGTVNSTRVKDIEIGGKLLSDLRGNGLEKREEILGEENSEDEPPLISGDNTKLTLSIMGKFKKTWCKTEPFTQLIKEPGCISRKIMNRFCYGQCNSFYIPKTLRKRTKKKVFKSCGFCKPKRTHTIRVTLKCPFKSKGYKHKKVRRIKQCSCMER